MLIIGCVIIAAMIMISHPIKFFSRMLIRGIIGVAGIFIANIFLAFTGIAVGVNLMTVLIVGLLGIPGFVALYVAQAVL
jgi:inhibitor of the pro-sigma K processing machinery